MKTKEYVFNHKDEFVTAKIFRSAGRQYTGGEVFDKESVSVRRLRQMFETGFLRLAKKEEKVEKELVEDNKPVPEVPAVEESTKVEEQPESAEAVEATPEIVAEEKPAKGKKGK